MKTLLAFGGNSDKIDRLFFTLSTAEGASGVVSKMAHHQYNSNYEVYYYIEEDGKLWNNVTAEIWFGVIAPALEDEDMSWTVIEVDPEIHDVIQSSFEGERGTDTNLLELFYVTTEIKSKLDV